MRRAGPCGASPPTRTSRAAVACSGAPETVFAQALQTPSPFERARTELCWGERLRRDGRRVDARGHLHAAHRAFAACSARRPGREGGARAALQRRPGPARATRGQPGADGAGGADRDHGRRGQDEQAHRDDAVPQPQDDRVPSRPRVPQARGEQSHRADARGCLRTRDSPGARAVEAAARVGDAHAAPSSRRRGRGPARRSPPPRAHAPTSRQYTIPRRTCTDAAITDPSRARGQPRLARRHRATGRQAARVPAQWRRQQLPDRVHARRHRGRDVSATTRSSLGVPQRGAGSTRRPPSGCGQGSMPPAAPSDCAFNIACGAVSTATQQSAAGERGLAPTASRTGSTKVLAAPRRHPRRRGLVQFLESGATPKWSETVIAGQSLGAGEAFHHRGQITRSAPGRGLLRLDGRQTRVGQTGPDAHWPLLRANPSA